MFSPYSKTMQIIGRITDLILLNILFLITSLPLFTIGASASALYTMCFRLMREEYSGIIKPYFRAFRANFRQSTAAWLVLLLLILPTVFYFDRLFQTEGPLRYAGLVFFLILVLGLMTASYVFPWISQFQNTTKQSLLNALILSISHLPRTVCILVIHLLPAALWVFQYELFLNVSFLWIALYFAAAAYMATGLLWHVFKPYRQNQTN